MSSETETNEAEPSREPIDADDERLDEQQQDDAEQQDDAKPKTDEPKKVKIEFEAKMPRAEAVSYFEAIVGGLRSGRLEFRQAEDTLVLSPPEQLEIEVKAQQKGDKAKIVFEIEWSEEHRALEIIN